MLLDQMFSGEKTETILTNGLSVLQTLMEFRRSRYSKEAILRMPKLSSILYKSVCVCVCNGCLAVCKFKGLFNSLNP